MIGVSDPAFLDVIAGALARLGARRALVVSSADGLDELSTSGATRVVEVDGGEMRTYEVVPEDVGLPRSALRGRRGRAAGRQRRDDAPDLRGRARVRRVTSRCSTPGPRSTPRAAPTGCKSGVRAAEAAIDSGAAAEALDRLVALTGKLAPT